MRSSEGFFHFTELLASAPDPVSKARLLSASKKESGAWLHTLPVTCTSDSVTIHVDVPRDVTGKVCNQSSDSFLEADKSLAFQWQWPGVQLKWKKPSLDLMTSVDVNLGQRDVAPYDIWTIEGWQNPKWRVVTPA